MVMGVVAGLLVWQCQVRCGQSGLIGRIRGVNGPSKCGNVVDEG